MKSIDIVNTRIAFEDEGEGPVLLFVHGHPFDRSMWQPQIRALASQGVRAIAPDLRGYGESKVLAGKVTLDIFARDLEDLLNALGVREPVVLCGLSMGGQIAMEFCKQFPKRVAGLALVATSPRKETEEGKQLRAKAAARILKEGMRAYARDLLPKMLAQWSIDSRPELALYVLQMMNAASPVGCSAALLGRAERPAYENTLAKLEEPSLVIVGEKDAFTTFEEAQLMHDLLKNSEFVWLKDVGHMPNLESTEEFNASLLRLLNRTRGVQQKKTLPTD